MTSSIDSMLTHFRHVAANQISQFGVAVSQRNWQGARTILDNVSSLNVTVGIRNVVSSSREGFRSLIDELERKFPPDALRLLFGGVMSGVGGAMLTEVAGLAVALGVSLLAIELIALVLLLWGLALALPAVYRLALDRVSEMKGRLNLD